MSHNAKVSCPNCEQFKVSIERKDTLIRDLRRRLKEFEFERINRNKAEGRISHGYV